MPPCLQYSTRIHVALITSIILLVPALPTRGWGYRSIKLPGHLQSSSVSIGLFKSSVDGNVYDTADLFPEHKDILNTTIILEGVGGCLLLVNAMIYLVFLLRKRHIILIVAFAFFALVSSFSGKIQSGTVVAVLSFAVSFQFWRLLEKSCTLLVAGASFFATKITLKDGLGYSWFMALMSSLCELLCVILVPIAIRQREFEDVGTRQNVPTTTSTSSVVYTAHVEHI